MPSCSARGDYMRKNGFKSAVIGLSGGIDSSLVAAIAVEAMGKENVVGVFMPSQYSSDESREDAGDLARNLGIRILEIPIKQTFESYLTTLRRVFAKTRTDVTEENLQAQDPGQYPYGPLEQVRLARAHHGQQERDVRWICHIVR